MAPCKLVRRNYGGKLPVSIKYQNLHSFKEGVILLCQSTVKTRRISHLHGSAPIAIPLSIIHEMQKSFDESPPIDVRGIFLGICKVSDKVWHKGIIYKLKSYEISGNLLKLIEN